MEGLDAWVSPPARVADPGEGISIDELRLAARNHGMPLELLRADVTPVGLHYVLTHYDIPEVDIASWRLHIDGQVQRPTALSLAELTALPSITRRVTLECAGNGRARLIPRPVSQPWLDEAVGTAEWTGTPLPPLLRNAGIADGAIEVAFAGLDHGIERGIEQDYERGLPLAEALSEDVLLVYAMNGQPLPQQHGAPLRLLVPGWYGMAQVKWLSRITVLSQPFDGYQNVRAYRIRDSSNNGDTPVTRIRPKALMMPPGFPDFLTRTRVVDRGGVELTGRAWSGWAPISRVDVSVDGGAQWHQAELGQHADRYAWRPWRWTWDATAPGSYELCARATDDAGNIQPVEQPWNQQGMANNHVQRVTVLVR